MNDKDFKRCFPFEEPRPKQRKIIDAINKSFDAGKKLVILCAPTAVGKSAIGVTIANYYKNSYMLTSQKSLQDQYMKDFSKIGMKLIKGRNNYICSNDPTLRCDSGVCATKKTKCTECPYVFARDSAYSSSLMVSNYAYFIGMHFSEFEPHEERDLLILDECHNTEKELIEFMTLKLSKDELHHYEIKNIVTFPPEKWFDTDKFHWLSTEALSAFEQQLGEDEMDVDMVTSGSHQHKFLTKRIKFLNKVIDGIRMADIYNADMNNGICVHNGVLEITFKPLYAKDYAKPFLLNYGKKVLAMSATVFDKQQFCKDLGFNVKDAIFISCDSPIPSDRRPIHNLEAVNLSYAHKEANKPLLVETLKDIMDLHKNERGIIHTVNYDIAKYVISNINSDRLIMPRGKDRHEMIDLFMNSDRDDLILISPSLTEGISLDDNLSRFTVVCKLPYGNIGDPWIKERMERDNKWYENETIQTLIQMTGRSVRSVEDFAVGYILDQSFNWFYSKTKDRFPKWWRTSLAD